MSLLVRYPPLIPTRQTDNHIVLNIDLDPTILAIAGAPPAPGTDGTSLIPLLEHPQTTPWRSDFLIEAYFEATGNPPDYSGIRTLHYTYVEYSSGEKELYDLGRDLYELNNVAGRPAYAAIQQLAQRRAALWSPTFPPSLAPLIPKPEPTLLGDD